MTQRDVSKRRASASSWTAVAVMLSSMLSTGLHVPGAAGQTETRTGVPDLQLEGGETGTVLSSLTVEGENQVQIQFERPSLDIDLDPGRVPGLGWDRAVEVLDRRRIDLLEPMIRRSAFQRSPYLARPWLDGFKAGAVARFRPEVTGVARWALVVANARGETVARFEGKGKPPAEITWDGRMLDGTPAAPGLTHSYVFEAQDEAGNRRNFVGEGFEIGAYRLTTPTGVSLMLTGDALWSGTYPSHRQETMPPALLLESASWLNQSTDPSQPIRVTATARSFQQAQKLADAARDWVEPHVIGDPARFRTVTDVRPDAPQQGSVAIVSMTE